MGANFLYSLFFSVCVSLLLACSSPEEKARDYNNQIVEALTDASLSVEKFESSLVNQKDIQASYDDAKKHVQTNFERLNGMGDYHGDTLLFNPAKRVLQVYDKLLNNEYNTLRAFHLLPAHEITFAITDSCKVLRMFVQNEATFVQQDFENAQQSFADRYHLELTD
jgi:hypothetical protein